MMSEAVNIHKSKQFDATVSCKLLNDLHMKSYSIKKKTKMQAFQMSP